MRLLIKIIVGFLAIVGALTIAAGTYLYVADPLGLKPLLMAPKSATPSGTTAPTNTNSSANPLLNPTQAAALEKLGIDTTKLPAQISPAMEACFTSALGSARMNEIKAGAAPTPLDLFKAKSCL